MTTRSTTEHLAEERMTRSLWMDWRIRRYGYPCLTAREVEAIEWEVYALAQRRRYNTGDAALHQALEYDSVLEFVAKKMGGVTRQTVHEFLCKATRAMLYFDDNDIEIQWERHGTLWRLIAPTAPVIASKRVFTGHNLTEAVFVV